MGFYFCFQIKLIQVSPTFQKFAWCHLFLWQCYIRTCFRLTQSHLKRTLAFTKKAKAKTVSSADFAVNQHRGGRLLIPGEGGPLSPFPLGVTPQSSELHLWASGLPPHFSSAPLITMRPTVTVSSFTPHQLPKGFIGTHSAFRQWRKPVLKFT